MSTRKANLITAWNHVTSAIEGGVHGGSIEITTSDGRTLDLHLESPKEAQSFVGVIKVWIEDELYEVLDSER